jgi:hypothetical protein
LKLHPTEVVDHFQRLCRELGQGANVFRHYRETLFMSNAPRYRTALLFSGPEITSIKSPVTNPTRRYIAGQDALEAWDVAMMSKHALKPQLLS